LEDIFFHSEFQSCIERRSVINDIFLIYELKWADGDVAVVKLVYEPADQKIELVGRFWPNIGDDSTQDLPNKADAGEEAQAEPPDAPVPPRYDRGSSCSQSQTSALAPQGAERLIGLAKRTELTCFDSCRDSSSSNDTCGPFSFADVIFKRYGR
jgi:hypothetical protein